MNFYAGIWLDNEKAHIIKLSKDGNEQIQTVESEFEGRTRFPGEGKNYSRLGNMFFNPMKKRTKRNSLALHRYFQHIIHNLDDVSEVYIFGPAEAKKFLEKEIKQNQQLANKLSQVDSADHLTQNQMLAKVKAFYANRND